MAFNKHLFFRKAHRYLGVFIGVQFLFWTISGLYFSWNNIDKVHGDHLRRTSQFISTEVETVSPSVVIQKLKKENQVDSIHGVHMISLLGKPVYQIAYFSGHVGEGMHFHLHYSLADAITGELRQPLTKEEAVEVAKQQVIDGATVANVEYLNQVDGHHEYREKPLPAWAITFSNPNCTAYVSAELGSFQSIRHNQWRAFDFLYMFHTMDYQSRDDFNNWLLKTFSVFGLITVLSGFILYFISSRTLKEMTT
jgi:uncharacterized iron-regulated membrane protein